MLKALEATPWLPGESIDEVVGLSGSQVVYRASNDYHCAGCPLVPDAETSGFSETHAAPSHSGASTEGVLRAFTASKPKRFLGKGVLTAWLDDTGHIHEIGNPSRVSDTTFYDTAVDFHGKILALAKDATLRLYASLEDLFSSVYASVSVTGDIHLPAHSHLVSGSCFFLVHSPSLNAVYALGDNRHFQLGQPYSRKSAIWDRLLTVPFFEDFHSKIVKIEAGDLHSLILCEDGAAYSTGSDANNQCGGFTAQGPTLVELEDAQGNVLDVLDVACGSNHSVLLTDQGVYVAGSNHAGQLGLGHLENAATFTQVPSLPHKVSSVSASGWNTYFLSQAFA